MTTITKKNYDLSERTFKFAQEVFGFTALFPKTISNIEVSKQVVRSDGSIGANYIEANEALSKKDFAMRIKICRKEAKETVYWLKLLQLKSEESENKRTLLVGEASELTKIFGAIVTKTEANTVDK
jgi:four helix bundle protein